jgi:predicted AAA+ superfamily ATPase
LISIIESCRPREGILQGTFNPEVFTASLSQVVSHYRGRGGRIDNLYTDADQFFRDGTAATDGIRFVLREALLRLSGDNSAPAIYRLETAFGGGKTHTLIALTHLAFRGAELAAGAAPLINGAPLPSPGECSVAGVAGDELAVHRPQGAELVPYTLWGEIAFQIGGEALYAAIGADATAAAAPGSTYFDTVFKGRKAIVMLDELAQYAARLEVARPNGAEQLAAFLLALHGYVRTHSGLVIVVTLASHSDAFARHTRRLSELLSQVSGAGITEAAAEALAQRANKDTESVAARDATPVVPVQAAELSRVLAKRLFTFIDPSAAQSTAAAYGELYTRSSAGLPDEAVRPDYQSRLQSHYPFHPTFLQFLNAKLASVETFRERAACFASLPWSCAISGRSGKLFRWCTPHMSTCAILASSTRSWAERDQVS